MIKYIKWFLLAILITSLIILGNKFINYTKNDFDISTIYNLFFYKKGIEVYENDELFSENHELNGIHYMTFEKDKVVYCDSISLECDEYSYKYENGKITIDAEDYFIPRGTYDVKYENEFLVLSIKDNINTIIYYLSAPVG